MEASIPKISIYGAWPVGKQEKLFCQTVSFQFRETFVRNALILNFFGLNWGKMTILFVPIRPCKRDEELEELEETGEK